MGKVDDMVEQGVSEGWMREAPLTVALWSSSQTSVTKKRLANLDRKVDITSERCR